MANASNKVIAGDYIGKQVTCMLGIAQIITSFGKGLVLDKSVVDSYELITDEHRKSAASGIARGLVGGALLGPVGMIGGAISAKNKGIYQIALQFTDGNKSLIEVDDKIYKSIVRQCF
ncbi:MAG: hypothetical protein R3Y47_01970 [Lachnospiraceae bacterium]